MKRWMIILGVLLVLTLISGGFLGLKLQKLQGEYDSLEAKNEQLQKKAKDQQNRMARLEQIKRSLEGQANQMRQSLADRLSEEKKQGGKVLSCEEDVAILKKYLDEADTELKFHMDLVKVQKAEIAKMKEAKAKSDKDLAQLDKNLARCAKHNQELGDLAKKTLRLYQDKDMLDIFAQKEPLTQINQARIESIVQEYEDKIDGQAFKKEK